MYVRRKAAFVYSGGANWAPSSFIILPASDLPTASHRWAVLGLQVSTQWPTDFTFTSPSTVMKVSAPAGPANNDGHTLVWPLSVRPYLVGGAGTDLRVILTPQPTGSPFTADRATLFVVAYPMQPREWAVHEASGT